ncbi:MAG TPA: GNAT family N-acetyltransferase [Solirubrobacterales bacterium]|jgi:GNAT superfamily N-acetyltransferase
MTKNDVCVRPVKANDSPALLELFEACFGTRLSTDYFAWKYYENPAGEVSGFVADAGDRLAAFYGVIPEPWTVGGTDTAIFQSMDTMTHPEFRRRGLFVRLAELTYDDVRHRTGRCDLVGIPGPASLFGFTGKLGWTKIHDFEVLTVPTLVARAWPKRGDRAVTVECVDRPDERIHRILNAASKPEGDAWPRLDGAFFDWRVFGRSPKQFRVALASSGGQPIALCVYTGNSPRATQISYVLGVESDKAREWFPPLLRFAAKHGVVLYTWRPQRQRLAALYRSMGFRANPLVRGSLPRRSPLIVRSDTGFVNGMAWADPQLFDLQPLMQD